MTNLYYSFIWETQSSSHLYTFFSISMNRSHIYKFRIYRSHFRARYTYNYACTYVYIKALKTDRKGRNKEKKGSIEATIYLNGTANEKEHKTI